MDDHRSWISPSTDCEGTSVPTPIVPMAAVATPTHSSRRSSSRRYTWEKSAKMAMPLPAMGCT